MTMRRSAGKMAIARGLWYAKPGVVDLRPVTLPMVQPGEARVRMLFSGISRGTERLVAQGLVPAAESERMRAPLQEGAFPFPVKYGYSAVGQVEDGPEALIGRTAFCLHPHQDVFNAPLAMLVPVPDGVPARRATLAANMETALNAHWDAGTGPADRIVVVGGGVVGLLVAHLAGRLPGADVTLIDVDPARAELAKALGARFAMPADAPAACGGEVDVVFHTSAHPDGLATALGLAGLEGKVVEMSWYGDKQVPAPLGAAFHSRRLHLMSSQVGQVSPSRRPRWNYRRRLEAALKLLADPALDALVSEEIAFADTPKLLPGLLAEPKGLAPVIRYQEGQ